MCLVLKRINRVVCLEDRKAFPMAGRGEKKEKRGQVRNWAPKRWNKYNNKKVNELEEVRETKHTLKEGIDGLIETQFPR